MTHRNRALLDLCHEAPCFLLLGFEGCGRDASVPCHSDMIRHGRGKDHKSHDCFAVPGCPVCHEHFKRSELGPDGYHQVWTAAMERWILYLWISGKIRLTDINQRPKETSMEAPMCKICQHRHYVRDPHIDLPAVPARAKSKVATPEHKAAQRSLNARATRVLDSIVVVNGVVGIDPVGTKAKRIEPTRKRAKKKAKKK